MRTNKTLEERKKDLDELIDKYKYPVLVLKSRGIAEKFGIAPSYLREIFAKINYSYKDEYKKLIDDFPPNKYTYANVVALSGVKINRRTLNKYAIKYKGMRYQTENLKYYNEVMNDLRKLQEEYEFLFIQLKDKEIAKKLFITDKYLRQLKSYMKITKEKCWRKAFRVYNPNVYTITEISKSLGFSYETIRYWMNKIYPNQKFTRPISITKLNVEKQLYGKVKKENRISMREIKKMFEYELKTKGYFSIKSARELGYDKFGRMLYAINERFGINVNYKYNRKEFRYELIK